jgi:predicted amino acid-binding ACT domain protein
MKVPQLLMTGALAMLILASCNKSSSDSASGNSGMQFQLKATNPFVVVNKPGAPGSINGHRDLQLQPR